MTADTITIGLFRNRSLKEAGAAAGIEPSDVDGAKQVLLDDLNARGVFAPRKVVAVWHEVDVMHDSDAVRAQGACVTFTQDNEVFAVLAFQFPSDIYLQCLQSAGVTTVASALSASDRHTFEQFPHHFETQLNLTRLARMKIDELAAQGFLTPGSRIGLVRYDTPRYHRAVAGALNPALAARGLALTEEFRLPWPQNVREILAQQSLIANAVLRFKTRGVDRVLFLTWDFWVPFQFMTAAQQQRYSPRYGLDTQDLPGVLEDLAPPEQLRGAVGFGWSPLVDVTEPRDPNPSAARRRCLDLLAARGHRPPSRGNASELTSTCDLFWLFEAAAKRAPALTADGFRQGAEALGNSYESATVEGTWFGAGRHDGAAAYRRLRFAEDCACFTYTSSPVLMP